MKKNLIPLLVVCLLVAAGGAIFWSSSRTPVDPAAFLPETTLAYAFLPDLERSAARWMKSSPAVMGKDPAIRPFLRRPMGRLLQDGNFQAAAEILADLGLERIFIAVTHLEEGRAKVLIGFQSRGGKEAASRAFLRLHQEIWSGEGDPQMLAVPAGSVMLAGQEMGDQQILTGSGFNWSIVSNDASAAADFFGNVEAEKAPANSLAQNAGYRDALPYLGENPDFLLFCNLPTLLDSIRELAGAMGAKEIASQFDYLEKLDGFAFSSTLSGPDIIERKFLMGEWDPDAGLLQNKALKFAPESSLLYLASRIDASEISAEMLVDILPADAIEALSHSGIEPGQIAECLGDEIGGFAWWPTTSLIPSAVAVAELKDPASAKQIAKVLVGLNSGEAVVTEGEGLSTLTFSSGGIGLLAPTLGFRGEQMFVALSPGDLAKAMETGKSGPGFSMNPSLKSASAMLGQKNQQFGILDLPALLTRAYVTLQPMLGFAAAMSPQIGEYVDLDLLPSPEDFTRHLTPIVSSQRQVPGGYLTELKGPVALSSILVGMASGSTNGFEDLKKLQEEN